MISNNDARVNNERKKYDAVIFDKDGVIADSEYCNVMAKHILLKRAGIEVDWHYHDQFLGTTHEYMWTVMKEEFHLPEEVGYYVKQWSEVRKELIEKEGMKAMPGSVELIRKLKADRIPMALASSSNVTDIEGDLEAIGITGVFDAVISGEHCRKGKPDAIKQDLHMADEVITDFAQLSVQDILCGRTTE